MGSIRGNVKIDGQQELMRRQFFCKVRFNDRPHHRCDIQIAIRKF